MLKMSIILGVVALSATAALSQSDNEGLNSKYYRLFDRLDIKLENDTLLGFTTVKPYNKKSLAERIEQLNSLQNKGLPAFSRIDEYNIKRFLMDNSEWTTGYQDSFKLAKPIFNTFYETPAHMYAVNTQEFTLRAEPVLNLQYGHANDGTGSIYQNTRGLILRGNIDKAIGFYTYVSDNQERDPLYVRQWVTAHNAVPGAGFYKHYGTNGYDYFDMKGGISFKVQKHIHAEFAYDKLFIGNGYRSLFLSDFSNNYLFARLSTRIWKLDYEMIIAQTIQSVPQVGREIKPQNYMAIHHLSTQVAPWLNVGFYENIMEDGKNGLQLSYLNPIIFYRATESNLGAAGKANVGFDFKSNISHSVQLYSQLLIDEFQINDILHYSNGSFANKQALQLGAKYINALGVPNLDLQCEANWIRPFTYTNFDSVTNLTHYNQPLAHPLGANVKEYALLAYYQPLPHLYLTGKLDYYLQGLDSAGENMGSDIFRSYTSRPRDYGFFIGTGIPVRSLTLNFVTSWEIFENMFLDFSITHRSYNIQGQAPSSVLFYTTGLRVNIARRTFDF